MVVFIGLHFISFEFLNFYPHCVDFNVELYRCLKELDLSDSEVDDMSGNWLSQFPDSYTSLESLNITSLSSEIRFSALERLVGRCPNLKILKLNRSVPLDLLPNLLRKTPHLIELGSGLHTTEVHPELYSKLAGTFSGCKGLRRLSVLGDAVPSYLPTLYSACSGLTSLNLSDASIQCPDLIKLVSQCQNLQRLWVCESNSVLSIDLLKAASICPQMG